MTGTRFGLDSVREAVRRQVAETSLRELAEAVGMSFSGLRSFLRGGQPQPGTRAKLLAWYVSPSVGRPRISKRDVAAAVDLLRAYLAESRGPGVRARRLSELVKQLS